MYLPLACAVSGTPDWLVGSWSGLIAPEFIPCRSSNVCLHLWPFRSPQDGLSERVQGLAVLPGLPLFGNKPS